MFDARALFESGIDDGFRGDGFSAAASFVRGDEDARFAVVDAVSKRFGRKSGKDDGVDGTDAGAGEEGRNSLPGHGKVYGDRGSFLDAKRLENIGNFADFAHEFSIGDERACIGFIGFVNDGRLATLKS